MSSPPSLHVAAGAGNETVSGQHRPPPRTHISWEFDNRNWLQCAAAPTTVPSPESNIDRNRNPSNNSHGTGKTRVGQASIAASSNDDAEKRRGLAGPHGNPEDVGTGTIAKFNLGEGSPSAGRSTGGSGSAAGAVANEVTGKSFVAEGRDGGAGDGGGDGIPHASGGISGGDGADVTVDTEIGWGSESGSCDNAVAVATGAMAPRSSAVAKSLTVPEPGVKKSGSEGGAEEEESIIVEGGLFQSVPPAASVESSGGDVMATGLAGLLVDEREYEPSTEQLATSTDVGGVDGLNTASQPGGGRRRQHEGKGDGSPASVCEGNSESGCGSTHARFIQGRQENNARSSSGGGEAQCTPRQTAQAPQQVLNRCSGAQDDHQAEESRASTPIVGGNPAEADGDAPDSASVWSSNSSRSTGKNSPTRSSRGSPNTVGEAVESVEHTTTTSGSCGGQERTTSAVKKDANIRDSHIGSDTADKGAELAEPDVSDKNPHARDRGRGTDDEGGGGDDSSGSVASSTKVDVLKPAGTQHEPGVTQSVNTSDGESRRSTGYRETREERRAGAERTVGDPRTAGEGESTSTADENEYGSDFASQVPQPFKQTPDGKCSSPFQASTVAFFVHTRRQSNKTEIIGGSGRVTGDRNDCGFAFFFCSGSSHCTLSTVP